MPIPSCNGCSLVDKGRGFVPPEGPRDARLLVIGYSPQDIYGPGKGRLSGVLRKIGTSLEAIRTHSILSCHPPEDEQSKSYKPWQESAIQHCQRYFRPTLREPNEAIVTLGPAASRVVLEQPPKGFKLNNWHGTVTKVNDKWVIPTFSPKYLVEGGQKLTGVVAFDFLVAKSLMEGRWTPQPATLRVDPTLEWFTQWVNTYLAALSSGLDTWLAVDTETVEKLKGGAEDELEGKFNQVVRINFSYNPDEGVTVPWAGPFIEQAKRLLSSKGFKLFWHKRYDLKVLRDAQVRVAEPVHDGMEMAKVLQSDLPLGLGFWAPFYSRYLYPETMSSAWKHLSGANPGEYAAIDGFQTLRIGYGLKKDLLKAGQWDIYMRHIYELNTLVLHPAEDIGLYIDRQKLTEFRESLDLKSKELLAKIQAQVGEDGKPLVGKWKKPKAGVECVEKLVELEVWVCTDCGLKDVGEKHKCKMEKPPKPTKPKKEPKPKLCTACKHVLDKHDLGWCFECGGQDVQCNHKPKKPRKNRRAGLSGVPEGGPVEASGN
jgi:uracil-DNA glycosylase